jgi:hypothetical protein
MTAVSTVALDPEEEDLVVDDVDVDDLLGEVVVVELLPVELLQAAATMPSAKSEAVTDARMAVRHITGRASCFIVEVDDVVIAHPIPGERFGPPTRVETTDWPNYGRRSRTDCLGRAAVGEIIAPERPDPGPGCGSLCPLRDRGP